MSSHHSKCHTTLTAPKLIMSHYRFDCQWCLIRFIGDAPRNCTWVQMTRVVWNWFWHEQKLWQSVVILIAFSSPYSSITGNCAHFHKGGWWYNACGQTNLNGVWYSGGVYRSKFQDGIFWAEYGGGFYSLKSVRMMIRPIDWGSTQDLTLISHESKLLECTHNSLQHLFIITHLCLWGLTCIAQYSRHWYQQHYKSWKGVKGHVFIQTWTPMPFGLLKSPSKFREDDVKKLKVGVGWQYGQLQDLLLFSIS